MNPSSSGPIGGTATSAPTESTITGKANMEYSKSGNFNPIDPYKIYKKNQENF